MNIHKVYAIFMAYFRPRRIRAFRERFPEIDNGASVLDVGGTPGWWKMVAPNNIRLTIVNLDAKQDKEAVALGYRFMVADGRYLPFKDKEFDLVVSNSVIEHVGDFEDQRRFAQEIMRCGKRFYVQTPNKWFPVEPHLIALGIHWLPTTLARRLVRWFSVWAWVTKATQEDIDQFLNNTRMLCERDVKLLFPGCEIGVERFLLLAKSFLVSNK